MQKNFDLWNIRKKQTDADQKIRLFHEREVWWCKIGINVGVEINGKHELFMRPVIIVRKFNNHMAYVVPTTSQEKPFYYQQIVWGEDGKRYIACLSQMKMISSKRLFRKIGMINKDSHALIIRLLIKIISGP